MLYVTCSGVDASIRPCNWGARPMIRISLPYVFNLFETLEPLSKLNPKSTLGDEVFTLWGAQATLETLLIGSVFSANLRSSRKLASDLVELLKRESSTEKDWAKELGYAAAYVGQLYGQFKTALTAEIGTFPAYFVSQKGSFDTLTLLDEPWRLFPTDLWVKVPEARFDVVEAGKALCYELATACGVHTFRAVESVLRRYYAEVTGGRAQPKVRNIAVYLNAMRQAKCGDEKVLGVLDHLSKLHRNPLAHPDAALTLDEAIATLGMAHSAITVMLRHLPEPPPTTTTAVTTS
jgi:hypothetical protein